MSAKNGLVRSRTLPLYVHQSEDAIHNYSSQALNSMEQAKDKLRQLLSGVSICIVIMMRFPHNNGYQEIILFRHMLSIINNGIK